jgi:hypothetical protein
MDIDRVGYANNVKIKFPEKLKEFPLECAYQSGYMRFQEQYIFSEFVQNELNYIRAFTGAIVINIKTTQIIIYPQFKIWENGIFSVLLRIISPDNSIDEDYLINNYINLFQHNTGEVFFPPEILYLGLLDYPSNLRLNIKDHYELKNVLNKYKESIKEDTFLLEDTTFKFLICPASVGAENVTNNYNIKTIIEYMFSSLSASVNKLYSVKRKKKCTIGNYWMGRPQVIIIDFKENQQTATLNHNLFQNEFAKMLIRTTHITDNYKNKIFHESHRAYDDYSNYLNEALGLWVYSREGMDSNNEFKDANNGHLIYSLQVKAELMDYFYLTFHKLYELAKINPFSFELFSKLKCEYYDINNLRYTPSCYGEINDLFSLFFDKTKLKNIEKGFLDLVDLKKEVVQTKRTKDFQNIGLILSMVFGMIGTLSFGKEIVRPLWLELGLWKIIVKPTENLFFFLVSTAILLLVLLILSKLLLDKRDE